MGFPTAQSAANLTKLRGSSKPTYAAAQYLSFAPNTTIFAARVNQASFGHTLVQLTYDGVTTGAYTDIVNGMTVYVSASNDRRAAHFVGRVRKTPTSSVLYINEVSGTSFADNDYIFVVQDYRIWDKLPYGDPQSKDYDLAYDTPLPVIVGLQSAYAGQVNSNGKLILSFDVSSSYASASGASISSYAWSIPASATITVGTASSSSITVSFNESAGTWFSLTITDSNSRTQTFHSICFPAGETYQPLFTTSGATIQRSLQGDSADVTAFSGVNTMLDETLGVLWSREWYNGVETNINGNIEFVGRLRTEDNSNRADEAFSQIQETRYTLEGTALQLTRVNMPLLALRYDNTPTNWDELAEMTVWRGGVHMLGEHNTALSRHQFTFDSTATTYRYQLLSTDGENAYDVPNSLFRSINAAMEFAPTGEIYVPRDINLLTDSADDLTAVGAKVDFHTSPERDSLPTVIDFTEQDWIDIQLTVDHAQQVGRMEAGGGFYNTTADTVQALLAIAPAEAQGISPVQQPFPDEILSANVSKKTAQAELNIRTGYQYAKLNNGLRLTVTHPDGYHWLVPSLSRKYTFTINSDDLPSGRTYTTADYWYCESVNFTHNNETGGRDVQAVYRPVTKGVAGQTQSFPPPQYTEPLFPTIPSIAPFPSFPPPPDLYLPDNPLPEEIPPYWGVVPEPNPDIPTDGNAVFHFDPTSIWFALDFGVSSTPNWQENTPVLPAGYTLRDVKIAPGSARMYALASDDTDSIVFTTPNGFSIADDWSQGATVTGAYNRVASTSTSGAIYIYRNNDDGGGSWSSVWDFTASDGGWAVSSYSTGTGGPNAANSGTYSSGNGWQTTLQGDGNYYCRIIYDFGTEVSLTNLEYSIVHALLYTEITFRDSATTVISTTTFPNRSTGTYSTSLSVSGVRYVEFQHSNDAFYGAGALLTAITLDGSGVDPNGVISRYSTDNGANWAAAKTIGAPVANTTTGGFDAIRIGSVVLAGSNNRVNITTSGGGAWLPYGTLLPQVGQPNAILMPRYTFGTTDTGNTTTSPEYLVGSGTLAAGSLSMWKVTSDGSLFTDITPSALGVYGLTPAADALAMPWFSGAKIAAIQTFGSERHLMTSADTGSTWVDRGTLSNAAAGVVFRRGDDSLQQLFLANGSQVAYSPSFGGTIINKPSPTSSWVRGVGVYG